jgi:hypothetical protein
MKVFIFALLAICLAIEIIDASEEERRGGNIFKSVQFLSTFYLLSLDLLRPAFN